jgi:hypothetical protein
MGVNYGASSGIVRSCLGSKNELNGSRWRIGDIASVGGEVERARKEDGLYGEKVERICCPVPRSLARAATRRAS